MRKDTKPVEVDLEGDDGQRVRVPRRPDPAPRSLDQAVAWFDCEVRQTVDAGDTTLFLGEIVACGFQKDEDTPVLRMEDTRMNYGG